MSRTGIIALTCWPFEISPLNELYMGKLVRSITALPFEIFLIKFGKHVYQVKTVCHVQELLLSLAGFLSFLP